MTFRFLLFTVGWLLALASRASAGVRAQLSRDLTLVIGSRDGIVRTYEVRRRRITSRPGGAQGAACTVIFDDAAQGARIFSAADAIAQIFAALQNRELVLDGDATVLLWFFQLTQRFMPWRAAPQPVFPDGFVAPGPSGKATERITREAVADALDPAWHSARRQREKLMIWQVGAGAAVTGKTPAHEIVTDVPEAGAAPAAAEV